MKAYVIHNPERKDRLELIKKEAATQGFEYELFDAIMKDNPLEGCRASHQALVRMAKENKMREILIMEDDVRFCGEGAFQFFLKKKPGLYDVYVSGASFYRPNRFGYAEEFSGLQAYFVHERFYDKFLSIANHPTEHIDYQLGDMGKIVMCLPFAAIQHPSYSDNFLKEMDYTKSFMKHPLYNDYRP